jgi:hypothetical protein
MFPVVLVDEPQGNYWKRWQDFIRDDLLHRGYISPSDLSLYHITDSVEDAVQEVTRFYRVYHSMRYVRNGLVLRLNCRITDATIERLNQEFADVISPGSRFEQISALPQEANEPALADLPRLRFRFNRHRMGRLRQLIDVINRDGLSDSSESLMR